jgi:hypothetical protein
MTTSRSRQVRFRHHRPGRRANPCMLPPVSDNLARPECFRGRRKIAVIRSEEDRPIRVPGARTPVRRPCGSGGRRGLRPPSDGAAGCGRRSCSNNSRRRSRPAPGHTRARAPVRTAKVRSLADSAVDAGVQVYVSSGTNESVYQDCSIPRTALSLHEATRLSIFVILPNPYDSFVIRLHSQAPTMLIYLKQGSVVGRRSCTLQTRV